MKLTKFATTLQSLGFEILFTPEQEYMNPADSFENPEHVKQVEAQMDWNPAAWFSAKVQLSFKGVVSEPEYLGGCSYTSFDDFTGEENSYFDDMLNACYDSLKAKVEAIKAAEFPALPVTA